MDLTLNASGAAVFLTGSQTEEIGKELRAKEARNG